MLVPNVDGLLKPAFQILSQNGHGVVVVVIVSECDFKEEY